MDKMLYPVIYAERRIDWSTVLQQPNPLTATNHIVLAAIHKAPEWAYEDEWRAIRMDVHENPRGIQAPTPLAIYMGAKIKPEDVTQLRAVRDKLSENGGNLVKLYQVRLAPTLYKMEAEPAD